MKPKFYSKNGIAILTLLLSPLLGSILFSYNLREIGRKQMVPAFILGSIVWIVVVKRLTVDVISNPLVQLLFANTLFSFVLSLLWDTYFGRYEEYEKKSVRKPALIFLSICVALLLLQILITKS